jgi:hypothetical protein
LVTSGRFLDGPMPAGPDGYRRDPASQTLIQRQYETITRPPAVLVRQARVPPSTQVLASVLGTGFIEDPSRTSLPDPRFDKLKCDSPIIEAGDSGLEFQVVQVSKFGRVPSRVTCHWFRGLIDSL